MKPAILSVITRNRMLQVRGRMVRTPFELVVTDPEELKFLETMVSSIGLEYSIRDKEKPKPQKKKEKRQPRKTRKKQVEVKSSASTLDKLLDD